MTGNTKRKILILLGLIALLIMIIAAGLPQLELQPGMPLPRLQQGQVMAAPTDDYQFVSISAQKFGLGLIVILFSGAILYATYQLIKGADWKSVSDALRFMLIISAVIGVFVFLILLFPSSERGTPLEFSIPTTEPLATSPLGPVPPVLLWLVGIGLLVLSVLAGVWIATSSRQPNSMDLVSLEAEKAWQAIQIGLDLKAVIIRCYSQMSLALKKEQAIERKDFMTTGEFEIWLEAAGIPYEPIHQLTRLFDAVRYGNWQPNSEDEQKAIHCLEEIMLYSRQIRRRN